MCLTVDKLGSGQDVVLTGSKDHHIKVRATYTHLHNCDYAINYSDMCLFLQVYEVAEGAQGSLSSSHTFGPAHQDGVESLAMHRDVFYSGSRDYYIKKWDLASKQLLQVKCTAYVQELEPFFPPDFSLYQPKTRV